MQQYRYRLNGSFCTKCKIKYYPFKTVCSNCHSAEDIAAINLQPIGRILSWTTIEAAPSGFEKYTPYILALIKLQDGPVLLSQICECEEQDIKKNLRVKAVFRKLAYPDDAGVIKYGLKFTPLIKRSNS